MSQSRWAALAAVLLLAAAALWLLWPAAPASIAQPTDPEARAKVEEGPGPRLFPLPAAQHPPARAQGAASPAVGKVELPPAAEVRAHRYLSGAWGGKPGQFGRHREEESNPEAPMALLAGRAGELSVLDQVNQRVQRFKDGQPTGSFPTSDTVQDLAEAPGGRTVLMDRLADKALKIYGPDGALVNELPLGGKGVPEPGLLTGVYADESGVWVEREHGPLVRVADADGRADEERPELPGRITKDGGLVVAVALSGRAQGELTLTAFDRATLEHRWSQVLRFRLPILHVLALESDARGSIYVAADVGREGPEPPYPILDEVIVVARIAPDGTATGTLEIPPLNSGDEVLRPISVGDDGAVYVMRPGDQGLEVVRYAFP